MINLLYEPLPDCIEADGRRYPVLTDFREWLRFADLVTDKEIPEETKLYLLVQWLETPPERITAELVNALFAFYKAVSLEPDPVCEEEEATGSDIRPPVFNWCIDAKYVLGDFRQFYGIDLLNVEYMHWWEFKSLFAALPDESCCRKRIDIRSKNLSEIKNKAERDRIARIQRQIALPFEYDDEMMGDVLWNMM